MDLPDVSMPSLGEIVVSAERYLEQVGETAVDAGHRAMTLTTGRDLREEAAAENAQAYGNSVREGIHAVQADLGSRFTGTWDSQVFVEESFDSMSHEAIMASVDRMDPAVVDASARGWTAIGDALTEALNDFKVAIAHEIGAGWSGIAADDAAAANATYVQASDQLAVAGSLVGSKVSEVATGIVQVKATIPPPANTGILATFLEGGIPTLLKPLNHEREEAREQAVQIMKTVYSPVMREADTRVPTLPAPLSVVGEAPSSVAGGGAGLGGGSGVASSPTATYNGPSNGGGGALNGVGEGAAVGDSTSGVAGPDAAAMVGDSAESAEGGRGPGVGNVSPQQNSSAEWTRPASVGADGVPVSGAPGGPGAGTGVAGGSGAGGHVGSGTSGTGTAGTSGAGGWGGASGSGAGVGGGLVGAPGSVSGGAGAASPAAASAGMRGGTAVPAAGMMPAGARGSGDDDSEHRTPGYLVNVDNGNDIVGTLPLVAPPVLGA